ncbi:MAG: F-box protein [Alphaproteobacteria bacterium]|nr:F-box protein [Alphaproteobacteria bacterium]
MTKFQRSMVSIMIGATLLATPTWAMELPDEIAENILIKLPPQTLARVSPVCKQWQWISEGDRLWQTHGFPSKEDCLKFPFANLKHEHLVALFKCKYVSGNGIFFWKLVEKIEMPDEIIKGISTIFDAVPIEWTAKNTIRTKKETNLIEYTTELTFWSEAMKCHQIHKKVPYTLMLKGSWDVEKNVNDGPYFPKLSAPHFKKLIMEKRCHDILGCLWKVKENQDFQDIQLHINASNVPEPYIPYKSFGKIEEPYSIYWNIGLQPLDINGDVPLPPAAWPVYRLTLEQALSSDGEERLGF